MATGSDLTGSIRQPASQCGIVGYQAPYGRIPMLGDTSFSDYCHFGPMTRTVSDCALMTNLMMGPDIRDHNSLWDKITVPDKDYSVSGLKIAVSIDLGCYNVSDDVRRETLSAVSALREAGAIVEETDVNWAEEVVALASGSQEFLLAGFLNETLKNSRELVSDYIHQIAETANSYSADDYRRSRTLAGEVWADHIAPLFQRYDAIITPTTTYPDIPATGWQKDTVSVNGRQVTDTETSMSVLWNMYSRCPVMSVPSGLTDTGLPTGIQIIGRPYDDSTVFHIAGSLEKVKPWLNSKANRPVL